MLYYTRNTQTEMEARYSLMGNSNNRGLTALIVLWAIRLLFILRFILDVGIL